MKNLKLLIFTLFTFLSLIAFLITCTAFQKQLEGAWQAQLTGGAYEFLLLESGKYYLFNNHNNVTNAAIGSYGVVDNKLSLNKPTQGTISFKGTKSEFTWERTSDNQGELLYLHLYSDTKKYRQTSKDIKAISEEGLNNLTPTPY